MVAAHSQELYQHIVVSERSRALPDRVTTRTTCRLPDCRWPYLRVDTSLFHVERPADGKGVRSVSVELTPDFRRTIITYRNDTGQTYRRIVSRQRGPQPPEY